MYTGMKDCAAPGYHKQYTGSGATQVGYWLQLISSAMLAPGWVRRGLLYSWTVAIQIGSKQHSCVQHW